VFRTNGTVDKRRYNAPTAAEVGGFMPGAEGHTVGPRDIVVRARAGVRPDHGCDRDLVRLNDLHPLYDTLHYVLLHPNGEHGWHVGIRKNGSNAKLTIKQAAVFYMHDRPGDATYHVLIIHGGRLLQEWLVDQYWKMEAERLRFLRFNQSQIRADLYQGLMDGLAAGETSAFMRGRLIVLPSSFVGSPR
jgi:hypothetical protein